MPPGAAVVLLATPPGCSPHRSSADRRTAVGHDQMMSLLGYNGERPKGEKWEKRPGLLEWAGKRPVSPFEGGVKRPLEP